MNIKTLRVILDIPVKPLDHDRVDYLLEDDLTLTRDDLALDPNEYTADELADIVKGLFHDEAVGEAFAGSEMYVTFGDPKVVEAWWPA